ncbi:hypothetical protein MUU74_03325 [Chryseobacterium daecheongense]|uniref:phBC6A51 family helix-turn-helix protein n=1 Tax=Chryseobacterium daecheongense TaxID=192389 RepID=UPI001FD66A75|nr:hypothetical protein [Chryseobacterium daecheongense]UOU98991.1 hypothetical protein MUU74_03325 [Chryseobacterium daecheongense]
MKTDKKPTKQDTKGLQKLTESENKIDKVLALKKIAIEDVHDLTEEDRNRFLKILVEKLNTLKGDELEGFCTQIEDIMHPRMKNELWENNHINIMWGITTLIKENGRLPSKTEIANKTGISRQTIYKHLRDYKSNPFNNEFQEQLTFMYPKLMSSLFRFAIEGDMKAAKLYLECIGAFKNTSSGNSVNNLNNNTLIQNQNNYIQIGGTILNQEIIQNLKPEQISTIEGILKTIEVKNCK